MKREVSGQCIWVQKNERKEKNLYYVRNRMYQSNKLTIETTIYSQIQVAVYTHTHTNILQMCLQQFNNGLLHSPTGAADRMAW